MGLSFSVFPDVKLPKSLINIYKELEMDLECDQPKNGDLSPWTDQGVMLLNTTLTVREGDANSHSSEWQPFTDNVIKLLSDKCDHLVFLLWGRHAQKKEKMIDTEKHVLLKAVHPSPLSAHRGFFGSRPFTKTNEQLVAWGKEPIVWN